MSISYWPFNLINAITGSGARNSTSTLFNGKRAQTPIRSTVPWTLSFADAIKFANFFYWFLLSHEESTVWMRQPDGVKEQDSDKYPTSVNITITKKLLWPRTCQTMLGGALPHFGCRNVVRQHPDVRRIRLLYGAGVTAEQVLRTKSKILYITTSFFLPILVNTNTK